MSAPHSQDPKNASPAEQKTAKPESAPGWYNKKEPRHTDQCLAKKTEQEPVDDGFERQFFYDSDGRVHDIDEMEELRG